MRSEYLTIFDMQEQNWMWFKKNYSRLVSRFDREYVAVFERKIVDHDKHLARLVRRVKQKFPFERVLVEFVSKEKVVLVL
mgnify:CR=1 FL=1